MPVIPLLHKCSSPSAHTDENKKKWENRQTQIKKNNKSEASSMKHIFYNDNDLKLGFTIAVHENKII